MKDAIRFVRFARKLFVPFDSRPTILNGAIIEDPRLWTSNLLSLARGSVVSSIFDRSLYAPTCIAPKMDKNDIKERSTALA